MHLDFTKKLKFIDGQLILIVIIFILATGETRKGHINH